MEFFCTDLHTDGKEVQNLQTEILYAMKLSMAVSAQILTKIVVNVQHLSRISQKIKKRFSRPHYVTDGHGLPIRFSFLTS